MSKSSVPMGSRPAVEFRSLSPVRVLIDRLGSELSAAFTPDKPTRLSRAPGRLDVMGGIAEYTGSTVCQMTLNRAAVVALQPRADRNVQIISLNLLDEGLPFTFQAPLSTLSEFAAETLCREFDQTGRKWAAHLAGCLFVLDDAELINLGNPEQMGITLALYSSLPIGAGLGSSEAIEVATMVNLIHHFGLQEKITPLHVAQLCQQVKTRIVGQPGGLADPLTSCLGETGMMMRIGTDASSTPDSIPLPTGVRIIGINTNAQHAFGTGLYVRTRCAAFMAHRIILEQMQKLGKAQGRELGDDPLKGLLANLPQDDYKEHFRSHLPEYMRGQDFLDQFGQTIDATSKVESRDYYPVQKAADHHILEARRVRQFIQFMQEAGTQTGPKRKLLLDKAGHLMYASHISYTNDALLGADECDRLVQLVRDRESQGLYGARISAQGSGGTVVVLADTGEKADRAIAEVMKLYTEQTGFQPDSFLSSSPGAWQAGTILL